MKLSIKPQHLKRYKDIAVLLLKYGREDIVKLSGLEETIKDRHRNIDKSKIEQLPKDLEELGPAYVKLGQFISTRSDLLPVEYLDALARLQDDVKPFPFEEIEKIITGELGVKLSKAFLSFDTTPLGAASLGQVHLAELRDGRKVVVKVQRPGITDDITLDLEVFSEFAAFLQEHTDAGRQFLFVDMIEEFRKVIFRELNYMNELQNLKILSANLAEFKNIIVPLPVEDYTTEKVLTMDFISGTKITSVTPLRKIELNGKELATDLFHSYMKQIVVDGFYHSDPHPGNIFLTDDNRIALLDLGMVGYVSADLQQELLHILLAIGDNRGDDVAEHAFKIGKKSDRLDKEKFRSEINELIAIYGSMPLKNIEIGKVIIEITRISGSNGINIPGELTMLGKTLLNLDKVGKTLDPKFEPNETIREYSDRLMKKKLQQSLTSMKSYELMLESKEFIEKLPSRVNTFLEKLSNNELELNVRSIDEAYLMNGFQKIANRITAGIIFGAMILGSSLLFRMDTSFKIFGYPGLAMIFFIIGISGGLFIAFSALFRDEPEIRKKE